MLSRLSGLEDEYQAVLARISDGSTQSDPKALRTVGKRLKELEPIVEAYRSASTPSGRPVAAEA